MADAKKKDQDSIEEMKAILRRRIAEAGSEKNTDQFLIAEAVERRIGVGNLEIYLDQFKKRFRDSIKPKAEEEKKEEKKDNKTTATQTAKTIEKNIKEILQPPIKIKVLSRERDPVMPPKKRKRK